MIIKLLFISILFISCNQNQQDFGGYNKPDAFDGIGLENPIGIDLPLTIEVSSLDDNKKILSDYFGNDIPKLLILGYYTCPMLCNSSRDNLFSQIRETDLTLGVDYEILMISINPEDELNNAQSQRDLYFNRYYKDYSLDSKKYFNFLTSYDTDIEFLTNTIGYEYKYDVKSGEYFHPSFIYVISDQGKIVDGLKFGSISTDIYDVIASAKENSPQMNFDQFYSFTCLQQDIENKNPQKAFNFLQIAGVCFVLSIGFGFGYNFLVKKEKKKNE